MQSFRSFKHILPLKNAILLGEEEEGEEEFFNNKFGGQMQKKDDKWCSRAQDVLTFCPPVVE